MKVWNVATTKGAIFQRETVDDLNLGAAEELTADTQTSKAEEMIGSNIPRLSIETESPGSRLLGSWRKSLFPPAFQSPSGIPY